MSSTTANRSYNAAVNNETLEDYSLRYAPRSFRKWREWTVANTALGGIAYLADFSIGGAIAISHGPVDAIFSVLVAALVIFLTGIPIAYYSARYNIDMDLLTRAAGFGYLGSTITSIVYASFCFIFFATEGSIMAQAFQIAFHLPLWAGYIVASLIVIPLVIFGMTALSKLQVFTQPIWLILMFLPFIYLAFAKPEFYSHFMGWVPTGSDGGGDGGGFSWLGMGLGMGVALSLIAQIGEQVDYLRFMPEKTVDNARRWWAAVMLAGPGWVFLGALKQLGGALLAFVAVTGGASLTLADEPIQQYIHANKFFLGAAATAISVFFVILSQIKINVVNAYSGSLSWSNFFSRVLHYHPGRVVWIFFSIAISLTLMECNMFSFLSTVLGFYSNVAVAWIGALVADLVVNKPLGLSPPMIEFKRAHLYNFNPVGFGSMIIASALSIMAYYDWFGAALQAYSPFLALAVGFALAPVFAWLTKGRYYIAREDDHEAPLMVDGQYAATLHDCTVCSMEFERPDIVNCPFHEGSVCSLCCSLDKDCHDMCKTSARGGNGTVKALLQITPAPASTPAGDLDPA